MHLTVEFRGLTISVTGSSTRAASLVQDLAHLNQDRPEPNHDAASVAASSTVETRASIEAGFGDCPTALLALSTRLSPVGEFTASDRIRRAWRAGQWAGAVRSGRVSSPNRTPAIGLPNRVYVVLQSPSRSQPALFFSSRAFFEEVGDLETSSAICHGFGSKGEARAYCAGAGVPYPSEQ